MNNVSIVLVPDKDKVIFTHVKQNGNNIYLPIASKEHLGVVQIDNGLDITPEGLLSVDYEAPELQVLIDEKILEHNFNESAHPYIFNIANNALILSNQNSNQINILNNDKLDKDFKILAERTYLQLVDFVALHSENATYKTSLDTLRTYLTQGLVGLSFEIVEELPTTGVGNIVYMVPYITAKEEYASIEDFPETGEADKRYIAEDTGLTYLWEDDEYIEYDAGYIEYIWIEEKNKYENIGLSKIQLGEYAKISWVNETFIKFTDIVDNLTTNDATKPLSAKQGKNLNDNKVDKVISATNGNFAGLDANGNLTDSTKKASDFILNDKIVSEFQDIPDDNHLASEKLVKDSLDNKIDKTDIVDNLTTDDATKPVSAKQAKILQDNKVDKTDIVDNLTTDDTTKVLSAKQGIVVDNMLSQIKRLRLLKQGNTNKTSYNSFITKTWTGITILYPQYIWTDGTNIYHSDGTTHHILNVSTSTWTTKTWSGLSNFVGGNIWTDGVNIYYSNGIVQYVLNTATSTWTTKTWNGLTACVGSKIWTDGTNIYHSDGTTHHILNVSTSTWTTKTWNGPSNFNGYDVWSDGLYIYRSSNTTGTGHYVLDLETSTWTTKTWSGLSDFNGYDVWTDGVNIYYSAGTNHKVLDITTSTWTTKTWNGLSDFNGYEVWTDGNNIYYSDETNNYVLNTKKINSKIDSSDWENISPSLKADKDASNLTAENVVSWQEKLGNSLLVADITVEVEATSITINDLDLMEDGGYYDIYMDAKTPGADIRMRVNNISSNIYKHSTESYRNGTTTVTGSGNITDNAWNVGGVWTGINIKHIKLFQRKTTEVSYMFASYGNDPNTLYSTEGGGNVVTSATVSSIRFHTEQANNFSVGTNIKIYKHSFNGL